MTYTVVFNGITLVYKLPSFKLQKLVKNCSEGTKYIFKRVHKTVTRGCELWPPKQRFEERFEPMSFRIV